MDFSAGSGLFWGWGWVAGVGVIILLGIFLLPWFFFLLNLQSLLSVVSPENRRMSPSLVWLNFIPVFHLGWFIYTVIKVRDSVGAELKQRGWFIDGDLGYNVGLTAGILWVASFVIGWIPFIGWVLPLAGVICWIVYWLKTSDLRNRLDTRPAWGRPNRMMYPPAFPPDGYHYPQRYGAPTASPAPPAPHDTRDRTPDDEAPEGGRLGADESGAKGADPRTTEESVPDQQQPDYRCYACGAHFDPGDWFCRKCGSRLY